MDEFHCGTFVCLYGWIITDPWPIGNQYLTIPVVYSRGLVESSGSGIIGSRFEAKRDGHGGCLSVIRRKPRLDHYNIESTAVSTKIFSVMLRKNNGKPLKMLANLRKILLGIAVRHLVPKLSTGSD